MFSKLCKLGNRQDLLSIFLIRTHYEYSVVILCRRVWNPLKLWWRHSMNFYGKTIGWHFVRTVHYASPQVDAPSHYQESFWALIWIWAFTHRRSTGMPLRYNVHTYVLTKFREGCRYMVVYMFVYMKQMGGELKLLLFFIIKKREDYLFHDLQSMFTKI